MTTVYEQWARFYDLVHAQVTADIPFYLALAQELGGPILELGCGSGRTLFPLAEANFEVVGLDNSDAMLSRARKRLAGCPFRERVGLVRGEMGDFDLGRRFPLITVPFHAWMHLAGRQQQSAALHCIGRHLRPGGQLVIDVPAPATIVEAEHDGALVLEGMYSDPETGQTVLQFSSTRLDEKNQLLHVTWIYDQMGGDGVVKRVAAPMTLQYLYPHEAKLMLGDAGLRLKTLWGNYSRSPYSAGSEKLIVVAEKQ